MLGQPFYSYSIIRKNTVAFASIFNDIQMVKYAADGVTVIHSMTVPIQFAPRQGYYAKLKQSSKDHDKTLPRLSFDITDIQYDQERQTNMLDKRYTINATSTTKKTMLSRVPYDISYDLNLYIKNVEDGLLIVEQILPFFRPSLNVLVEFEPTMGIKEDVQVILNSITKDDNYESGLEENRLINWTMNFTTKTWLYPPIVEQKIILNTTTNTKDFFAPNAPITQTLVDGTVVPPLVTKNQIQ